jgi:Secretion system C-terminal sorting domain
VRNKVLLSLQLTKEFLLLLAIICCLLPATVSAQTKKTDSSFIAKPNTTEEIKIRQRGTELQLQFPKTSFRSALKIVNTNGAVMKAVMIDEGSESISVSLNGLPKGIYQCVIENRTQRFVKKILLQ